MFDGKVGSAFQGFVYGAFLTESKTDYWLPVIMRLPEGSAIVKYWDYAHTSGARCQVRKSSLEGSVDGRHWEPICTYDIGESLSPTGWEFKRVAIGHEAESEYGAPGQEIRGTTTNVWNFMTGNPVVSVKPGATLKAVGDVTLKNIKIDASTGAGTFDGFTFAADTQVEVTNLNAGEACVVPASFKDAAGLDDASGWTWTFVSQTGRTLRGRGAVSATGVRYIPMGTRISIQ